MTQFIQLLILGWLGTLALQVQAAPPTDTLNIGIAAEFENLNPLITQQSASFYMLYTAWRPLVTLSPDSRKWEATMIKEIPTLENKLAKRKGQGLEAKIEIRDEAQWGDGVPVTCADVAFTWKVGLSKNVSVGDHEPYENISAVNWDKASPKKCTIEFKKARFNFYQNMPDPLPSHLEEAVFEKFKDQPEGYDRNSNYTKNPSNPGLWDGPFMVSEVKLGSHVIVVENPKYNGKKPSFKKIVFKLIPNGGVLTANLRSGNIDMIASAGGLDLQAAADFEQNVKSGDLPYSVLFEEGLIYGHIDLNLANPILAEKNVRLALAQAFNRDEINSALLKGKAKSAIGFITDRDPWYTTKVKGFKYDRKAAAKLLDEAGWKMGPKGIREKNGKPLSLTLITSSGAKVNEQIQTYLQSQFKAIGVQLLLKNEPARVFFGTTLTHRQYDMALYSWVSVPESSPRSTLSSASIPSEKNSWSGQNSGGYSNADVDKEIDQLEMEMSAKKRAEIGAKILGHYVQDVPVLPLYYRPNDSVNPKDMKGFQLSGNQFAETLRVEDWHM